MIQDVAPRIIDNYARNILAHSELLQGSVYRNFRITACHSEPLHTKCLCPLQKFDSDTERHFPMILERDASKWFKRAKGQFQIHYKLGSVQPEYVPDFVVEMDSCILLAETKKAR